MYEGNGLKSKIVYHKRNRKTKETFTDGEWRGLMVFTSVCHLGGLGSIPTKAWNFLDDCKNETKT